MLIYTREQDDHAYRDESGNLALWKGRTYWYFSDPAKRGTPEKAEVWPRQLCPIDWPDGDAIQMYRAKLKAAAIRSAGALIVLLSLAGCTTSPLGPSATIRLEPVCVQVYHPASVKAILVMIGGRPETVFETIPAYVEAVC